MENNVEMPEYAAGDEISLELRVVHEFRLGMVAAVFEHEGQSVGTGRPRDDFRIVLAGRITQQHSPVHATAPPARSEITSTVALSGEVTANNVLGPYRLTHVEAEYRGGRRIQFDLEGTENLQIRVVEERVAPPKIVQWRLY
jgi:hypothetical protein